MTLGGLDIYKVCCVAKHLNGQKALFEVITFCLRQFFKYRQEIMHHLKITVLLTYNIEFWSKDQYLIARFTKEMDQTAVLLFVINVLYV